MKMQQTKSYWQVVAALGLVGAFVASACVVTTSTDGGTAGDAGAGDNTSTAGSTSAGASSGGASAGASAAGSGNTAGSGGDQAVAYQCDTGDGGAPPGTPNTCDPDADHLTDPCALCVKAKCCTEYSQCFATDPGNQCGWGGPNDGGEIICMQQCIKDAIAAGGVDDIETRSMCNDMCVTTTAHHSTHDCGSLPGSQTNALLGCLSDNCATECLGG
jgi:hypothetical protein